MRVVSLKVNSNVYPLKSSNSHYLLLNTTIIPLSNGKISLIFSWGLVQFEIFEQIWGAVKDSLKRFKNYKCFAFHLSNYYYM